MGERILPLKETKHAVKSYLCESLDVHFHGVVSHIL